VPSIQPKTENRIRDIGAKVWLAYLGELRKKIAHRIEKEEYEEKDLSFAYNYIQTLLHLEVALEDAPENWVWTKDDEDDPMFVSFKPIEIGEDAESMLLRLGRQRIFMSATIPSPSVFMRELGLNEKKTLFLKVDYSSFPTGNRPIITTIKGGKMSYGGRNDDAFTETAEAILQIMDLHDHEKGIILPYTNEIEERLFEEIKRLDPDAHSRLMTHTKDATDREEVLAEFEVCPDPAVLLSTYVNQGYDGKHCGFAIIVKIPFPPLGDVRTVKKMERDEDWYKAETAGSLIQMCGRVVRSVEDTGITYIVDPTFDFHYNKGINNQPLKKYMPSYIDEAIM
jgi:Rad3-related DNA helicase